MCQIEPYFPLSHGVPRVDDRRVLSGIIFVIRNVLRWRDAPAAYGPHKACPELRRRGYDSDEYRAALKAKGITPCIPPRKGRILPASFDKAIYKQRHKIENMFGKLKDWRRTRYDRCAHTFLAAITIAAIFIFWIN